MTLLNYSLTLVPGTNENVEDVQTMFEEVRSVVNDLDNSNIASDAAIAYSKIDVPSGAIDPLKLLFTPVYEVGGGFEPAVTAPADGLYLICFRGYANAAGAGSFADWWARCEIQVAGATRGYQDVYGYQEDVPGWAAGTPGTGFSITTVQTVASGEQIKGAFVSEVNAGATDMVLEVVRIGKKPF